MISSKHSIRGVVVVLALAAGTPLASAQTAGATGKQAGGNGAGDDTREVNLRAYTELLRSDLRAESVAIITEVMAFSEAEDAKFWPIYRDFESQLAAINTDRIKGIKDYADNFDKITDEIADRLVRTALSLEERRHALKVQTYERLKAALSPKTAARFLQVENQILLLLDLQIAASLPIVQ